MGLLSFTELVKIATSGVIENVEPDYINSASIDITLGAVIMREKPPEVEHPGRRFIDLGKREPMQMRQYTMDDDGYILHPGEFILASSQQIFNLPNYISAEYKLKSSMARIGLNHLNAGWCDAGWNGSALTLELKNTSRYHAIRLHTGDRIGQMVFFKHAPVPHDKSYATRGRYNGDKEVRGIKP